MRTSTFAILFTCLLNGGPAVSLATGALADGAPVAWRVIDIPPELLAKDGYGGDVRMGDLDGDGMPDFVVFRSTGGQMKPCFIGAFDVEGRLLWRHGAGGGQPLRPGPVAIYDFDADDSAEMLCFFVDPAMEAEPASMKDVVMQVRSGRDGHVLRQATCPALQACSGTGPNWCHQRLLIANFRGTARPRDFVVKLGAKVLAFDDSLNLLWTYEVKWNEYSRCSAYIPAVGDIDGDGRDEVVLRLGETLVPHGQEVRVADFDVNAPGPEMIIRHQGHNPDVLVVANDGNVRHRFKLNDSPNHTGMEAVRWNGEGRDVLLYNGGALWHADGRLVAELPGLPKPVGPARMGWYHCIAADVCSDAREEAVLYNPWDRCVWIFTPAPVRPDAFRGYRAGPRQFNPRLMD